MVHPSDGLKKNTCLGKCILMTAKCAATNANAHGAMHVPKKKNKRRDREKAVTNLKAKAKAKAAAAREAKNLEAVARLAVCPEDIPDFGGPESMAIMHRVIADEELEELFEELFENTTMYFMYTSRCGWPWSATPTRPILPSSWGCSGATGCPLSCGPRRGRCGQGPTGTALTMGRTGMSNSLPCSRQ